MVEPDFQNSFASLTDQIKDQSDDDQDKGVHPNKSVPDTDELRLRWTMKIVDKVDIKYQMAVQMEEFKKLSSAHVLPEY